MFCARVLRTPRKLENSTGSNISTSTPVSCAKSRLIQDEPDHSPIEKSNDNSKQFKISTNGANSELPFSPLAGCLTGSYLRSKRSLILQNMHSTPKLNDSRPRASHAEDSKKSNVKEAVKRDDPEERPIRGLRISPRNISKLNKIGSANDDKESKKCDSSANKNVPSRARARTKSNIPTRRRSLSLQELAIIKHKKDSVQHDDKPIDMKNMSKTSQTQKCQAKNIPKTQLPNSVNDSIAKTSLPSKLICKSKSNLESATIKSSVSNSRVMENKKESASSTKEKSNVKHNIPNNSTSDVNIPINSKLSKDVISKSKEANSKTNSVSTKSKTVEIVLTDCKTIMSPKRQINVNNKIATSAKTQNLSDEEISKIINVQPKNNKQTEGKKRDEKEKYSADKDIPSKPSEKLNDEFANVDVDKECKSSGKRSTDTNIKESEKQNENGKPPTPKKLTENTNKGKRTSPRKVSPFKPQEDVPRVSSTVGAKIFASKSNDVPPVDASNRDSYGSQRNSDTFQVNASSKTFAKRKLYSQCNEFNDESSGTQDTSFLTQKDNVRNIYCAKKNINAETKTNAAVNNDNSKSNDRIYSLRNNNHKNEEKTNIRTTSKFVTKILQDINSKNKSKNSDDADDNVEENKHVAKEIKPKEKSTIQEKKPKEKQSKKMDEKNKSSDNIFDNVTKGGKKNNKETKSKTDTKTCKIKKHKMNEESPSQSVKSKSSLSGRFKQQLSSVHSKDLILVKSDRSAKKNAIKKIHNWSLNVSRRNSMQVSSEKKEKKRIIVNRECSYILRSYNNDSNVSLSPHLRKAISKLREQNSATKKPVRRSLEISLNKKKAIVSSTGHKNFKCKDNSLQFDDHTGGKVLTFKNGQLITVKAPTNSCASDPLDDSFYEVKKRKVSHNVNKLPTATLNPTFQQDTRHGKISNQQNTVMIPKYNNKENTFWEDPREINFINKFSETQCSNNNNISAISRHYKINKTFICSAADTTNRNCQQLQSYNPNLHAVVQRPTGVMDNFKLPMGMPDTLRKRTTTTVSYLRNAPVHNSHTHNNNTMYSNKSIIFTNPLDTLLRKRIEDSSYSDVRNEIPDFIKYPCVQSSMSHRYNDPAKSSYSICTRGVDVMKNRCDNDNYDDDDEAFRVLRQKYGMEDSKKRKCIEDVNDVTFSSKRTKYDDEMSLCSSIIGGSKPMSSTRIYNNTLNRKQDSCSNQSVCKFIIGGPLMSIHDNNRICSKQETTIKQINKPSNNIQMIKHTVIEQVNSNECSLSADVNQTVINAENNNTQYRQTVQGYKQDYRQSRQDNMQDYRQSRQDNMQDYRQSRQGSIQGYGQSRQSNMQDYRQSRQDVVQDFRQSKHGNIQDYRQSRQGNIQDYRESRQDVGDFRQFRQGEMQDLRQVRQDNLEDYRQQIYDGSTQNYKELQHDNMRQNHRPIRENSTMHNYKQTRQGFMQDNTQDYRQLRYDLPTQNYKQLKQDQTIQSHRKTRDDNTVRVYEQIRQDNNAVEDYQPIRHKNKMRRDDTQVLTDKLVDNQVQSNSCNNNQQPNNSTIKKYKFSSEDVYNFGKKPQQSVRTNDVFYFKGACNNPSDSSGVTAMSVASNFVGETFKKPSTDLKNYGSTHNSSILDKYYRFHSTRKPRKTKQHSTASCTVTSNQTTPVSNKNNLESRSLVSPWRLL